jgi:hypothetical protein
MSRGKEGREPVAGELPRLVREPQALHPRLAAEDPGHLWMETLDVDGVAPATALAHADPRRAIAAAISRAEAAPRSANWRQRPA